MHGLDPLAAPSQRIWGYETTWGSFAQFTKVQAQQLLPQSAEPDLGGGRLLRPRRTSPPTECSSPDAPCRPADRVLMWGAAGGLGVFAVQLCAAAGAECVGVVSSPEKGELVKSPRAPSTTSTAPSSRG